jgi:predicted RNase H-like HicB family nuclease
MAGAGRTFQCDRAHEPCEDEGMAELVFEVTQEADGGYCAECLTLDIFTQADSWEELRANVRKVVRAYFFDGGIPERIRLHLVRDEVLAPV